MDYWMRQDYDWQEEQQSKHDQIADWIDSASVQEIIDTWYGLDAEPDKILNDVVNAAFKGENVSVTFRNRIHAVCEQNFDRWPTAIEFAKACAK